MKKQGILAFWLVVAALLVAGFGGSLYLKYKPSELNEFAQCLKDRGAVFYGAFWCPHCQAQKKTFGTAQKFLPYVECSSADGQSQLPVCAEKGIEGYPTWEFENGERMSGEIPLDVLSERTGCPLPGASSDGEDA